MLAIGNFEASLNTITDYWSPKIIGQINGQYVKVAKLKGEFVWHKHEGEDEMFYIVKGALRIEYEAGEVNLNAGDFHIVPRNTLHNPVAEEECWVALIEPVATKHTGDVITERTKSIADQLS
ncbi:cupin domain-containing protein [Woodsholea maritima]|uniref:cupin domain-containing protein n=1 Tax=Woodsholea maritima TaxID=240237 RepID=UPI00036E0C48|nr:cupin domain-containing protein [Woodsholea maritima]